MQPDAEVNLQRAHQQVASRLTPDALPRCEFRGKYMDG